MTQSSTVEMPESAGRPGLKEQLTYVGGEFASNFAWNMVAGFLLFYYTDIALLPVAMLGTLMLVSRVLDAAIDPLVGVLVDRTRTRWGQARPYLLFASIPFGILCVLTFAVPVHWSPMAKVVYAYVTFTVLGLLYSLVYIPYGALQPMMVRDPLEKVRIGSWRAMATSLASIVVYSLVIPLSSLTGPGNRPLGFLLAAAVVSAISVALYLSVFAVCRERFTAAPRATSSIRHDVSRLLQNRIWWFVFLYMGAGFVSLGILVSVAAYFANNVLKQPGFLSLMLPLLSVSILSGGFLASFLLRRLGMRVANVGFLALSVTMYLLMPQLEGNPTALLAAFMAANIAGGVIAATGFISCTDAVEYHEARFGDRNEGLVVASVSFGMKVGMAVGAAATAYALSWAGYTPGTDIPRATQTVRALFYYAPVGLAFLQIVIILALKRTGGISHAGASQAVAGGNTR